MAAPVVTMQHLLEAGAHFGHQTHRWNPRMKPYIFGARNGIHILDLSQSVPLFARALDFVAQSVSSGGKVLFVGTKRQAQGPIADAARASGQHFVNHRWLGGMLTNWNHLAQITGKSIIILGGLLLAIDWYLRHNERQLRVPAWQPLRLAIYFSFALAIWLKLGGEQSFIYFQF